MIDLNNFKEELSLIKEENEILNMDLQKAIEIFEDEGLDSDFVKEREVKTPYNTIKCFGDYSTVLMSKEDLDQFIEDNCNAVAACLGDLDVYFDSARLSENAKNDIGLIGLAQWFLEKEGRAEECIKDFYPTMNADVMMVKLA